MQKHCLTAALLATLLASGVHAMTMKPGLRLLAQQGTCDPAGFIQRTDRL